MTKTSILLFTFLQLSTCFNDIYFVFTFYWAIKTDDNEFISQ